MRPTHPCSAADCAAIATDRCFECGAWCCEGHLSAVQLPTHTTAFREELCSACLLLLESPDRYGRIVVEPLASALGNTAAADGLLGL